MADEDTGKEQSFGERVLNEAMRNSGVKTDEQGNLGVTDAIKLKHSINSDIRYFGLNAQEIEEKKKITFEEWKAAKKWYRNLVEAYDYSVHWFWYVATIAVGVYYFAFAVKPWQFWSGIALALLVLFVVGKLFRSQGFNEGFFIGYENGWDNGINKLLGIDEKESQDIHERATEMKIDSGVIAHLDEHKSKQS